MKMETSTIGPLLLMPFHFSGQKHVLSYLLDLWLLMYYYVCNGLCVQELSLHLFLWRPESQSATLAADWTKGCRWRRQSMSYTWRNLTCTHTCASLSTLTHTHTHIHKSSVCSPQHVTKRLLLWAAADASVWCSCDVTGHERGSVSLSAAWMSECTRSRHTSTRRAAAMAHRLGMMWVNDSICSSSLAHCFYHSAPVLNCVLCGGFLMGLQVCVCDDRHNDGEAVVVMKWAGCAAVVNDSDSAVFEVFSCVIQNMRSSVCVCVCLAGADVHYDAISQSHALEQNVLL